MYTLLDFANCKFIVANCVSSLGASVVSGATGPPELAATDAASSNFVRISIIVSNCVTSVSPNTTLSSAEADPKFTLPACSSIFSTVSKFTPSFAFRFIVLAELSSM